MNSCSADKNTSEIIIHIRVAKKGQDFGVLFITNDQKYIWICLNTYRATNRPCWKYSVWLCYTCRYFAIWILGYLEMFNILNISNRWSGNDEWKDNVANRVTSVPYIIPLLSLLAVKVI